jgi:hypothetical protein
MLAGNNLQLLRCMALLFAGMKDAEAPVSIIAVAAQVPTQTWPIINDAFGSRHAI